jgi:hypothetical protein
MVCIYRSLRRPNGTTMPGASVGATVRPRPCFSCTTSAAREEIRPRLPGRSVLDPVRVRRQVRLDRLDADNMRVRAEIEDLR